MTSAPPVPAISTRPWSHQQAAVEFAMRSFHMFRGGCMLAMRMGTGKSLCALMLISMYVCKLILIICPKRVINVWKTQFAAHWDAPVIVCALSSDEGTVAKRQRLAERRKRDAALRGIPLVVVINFEAVWAQPFAAWALGQKWDAVIVDESHRAKTPRSHISLFLARLRERAAIRLMLTGTPMPHSPLDIWAQMRFIWPGLFPPSYYAFRARYAVMGGYLEKQVVRFQNQEELSRLLQPVCLRVDESVLDLPESTDLDYECELSSSARHIYNSLEKELLADLKSGKVTAANGMVRLLRLQQITGGSLKADDSDTYERVDTGKLLLLADLLEDLGPDQAWVCFARFRADLDGILIAGQQAGHRVLELSGRRDDLAQWQAGKATGLAVQISAGGVGVDLTRACYSIFWSLSFSLAEYEQARARTVRPGQKRNVSHIHLLIRNSVDHRIRRALERRAEVIEDVLRELQHA